MVSEHETDLVDQQQPQPPLQYRQAKLVSTISNSKINRLAAAIGGDDVDDISSSTYVKSNFIRPRLRDIEFKHETSV